MYGRMKEEGVRLGEGWLWVRAWVVGEERRVRKGVWGVRKRSPRIREGL